MRSFIIQKGVLSLRGYLKYEEMMKVKKKKKMMMMVVKINQNIMLNRR
jgi:hypothetical protein